MFVLSEGLVKRYDVPVPSAFEMYAREYSPGSVAGSARWTLLSFFAWNIRHLVFLVLTVMP